MNLQIQHKLATLLALRTPPKLHTILLLALPIRQARVFRVWHSFWSVGKQWAKLGTSWSSWRLATLRRANCQFWPLSLYNWDQFDRFWQPAYSVCLHSLRPDPDRSRLGLFRVRRQNRPSYESVPPRITLRPDCKTFDLTSWIGANDYSSLTASPNYPPSAPSYTILPTWLSFCRTDTICRADRKHTLAPRSSLSCRRGPSCEIGAFLR